MARRPAGLGVLAPREVRQRLKPDLFGRFSARLKSCPDTRLGRGGCLSGWWLSASLGPHSFAERGELEMRHAGNGVYCTKMLILWSLADLEKKEFLKASCR